MRRTLALAAASYGLCAGVGARAEEADSKPPIIVTATKKPGGEELERVPAAITAFDGKALAQAQYRDLQSLSYSVPGVSLDPVGTFRGVANFSMRGLGINSSIPSIDASVGTVVDGVYLAANSGLVLDGFDIASVEVLRGPQGVLFGRNTTAGAVLVNTADPSFAWEGHSRVSGEGPVDSGRGAMRGTGQLVVSGPIVADRVAIRLGAYLDSDGGWFRNLRDGSNFGKAETTVLRAGVRALITDHLTLTAKGEYLRTTGDGATTQNHGLFSRDGFDMSVDNAGFIKARSHFVTARLDWEVGPGTLTNIAGWRRYTHSTSNDIDSTPSPIFHSKTQLDQEQWSDELHWSGKLGPLDLTTGGYIFHQDVAYGEDRAFGGPPSQFGGGTQDHHVQGLFAQGDLHATPALTLTAGLRWSHEEKAAAITYVRPRPACSVVAGTCPVAGVNTSVPGEPNGIADKHSWSSLSPKLGVSYQLGAHALAYASWTRGVRSGGYNLRVTNAAAFQRIAAAQGTAAFGEERVDSYEIGLKLASGDGRASINAAAYRMDVNGVQRELNVPVLGSGLAQYIYNTGDARIHGGEIEAAFAPTAALRLTANAGYIDADYVRVFLDLNGDNVIDAADRALKLPRAPRWTFGGTVTHQLALGEARTLTSRVAYQYRSRYAYTDNNVGFNSASHMLDASVALDLGGPAIRLTLYGRNLLDQVQFGGDTQLPFGGGPFSDGNSRPFDPRPAAGTFSPVFKGRTVGIEAAMDF
ncbi:MAG: TonB-dependent receptor [Novosphingobium sp.]